ncbi:MAG: LamG-like jellyroll fold domain-containing protein, partial [bacterium]
GTLEFWIKPRWNGNDGEGYVVLRFGVGGGMYFAKDGANNWRSIFNRFGVGSPEVGVAFNVSAWQAGQWHHAAFTWKSDLLKLYVDGLLLNEYQVPVPLNFVNESTFQLGADFSSYYLDAVIDELGISDIARSTEEIQDSFLAGLRISSLTLQPNPIELLVTQETTPTLIAVTNLGTLSIPPAWARWKSSKPSVASVDENGRITGNSSGRAKITASLEGESASAIVIVGTSSLPASDLGAIPDDDSPHAQPMDGASFALNTGAEMKLQGAETPATYALAQNYPNPFNPETEIRFQLPQASHVVMKIFNILGEEIRTLVDEQREAGYHGVRWDGRDKNGNPVASGVYLYQLQAGSFSEMKKMSLLR